ncbi:MAG: CFI-box-CTERM domain-containing protein [Haloplanus sp.]
MSTDDGSETAPDKSDDTNLPPSEVGVGDGREKYIQLVTTAGKEIDHGDAYVRHSETEFLVSPDEDFPPAETTRYQKDHLERVEITQHHSNCFITTAAAGEGPTLESLRGFRTDVMAPTHAGRALLTVYEAISPPIAATLDRHPEAAPTRLVRWLVDCCGSLADRRRAATTAGGRAALSITLIALYVVGVVLAALGHGWLRARERAESEA